MAAKATISSGYRWRLGLIAVLMVAFACWFFYDAVIGYPAIRQHQLTMRHRFEQLKQDHPANYTEKWQQVAHNNGWAADPPGPPKTPTDILAQYLYGIVCIIVGLPFAYVFVRSFGRWIASDEQGLSTSWGQHAPWTSLQSIDTRRWKTKGIVKVNYQDEAGKQRVLTLDDWKYQREPVTAMFNEVRDRLGIETDTPPPPPPQPDEPSEPQAQRSA